jgi:glycosyltransferase involved in cell wall biosynthesis
MKLSIITCTWNSIKYIDQSIESVLSQDSMNFEYIFVDGGSVDGTLERIAKIDRPVTVIPNVRGGIAHAMNEGIRAATGDIIAHMHSDDYFLGADVFSRVSDIFESTNCLWLYGRIFSDVDGTLEKERYTIPKYDYRTLLKRNIVPHAATFVRRDVFTELGLFNEDYRLAMDYEMWLRIGKKYAPVQLDDYLAAFRRHPGSATQANRVKSFNEDFIARFEYAPLLRWPEFALRYGVRRWRLMQELSA